MTNRTQNINTKERQEYWNYCSEGGELSFEAWKQCKEDADESTRLMKEPIEVNIFPDPVKYLTVMITNMAIEENKEVRLNMATIMLDAVREVVPRSELEVSKDGRSIVL